MRKLSVSDMAKNGENCYSFVVGIAKRARQIAGEANDSGEILDEKPVQMAIEDFLHNEFRILPPEIKVDEEQTEITENNMII